jgi:hypothetical protein
MEDDLEGDPDEHGDTSRAYLEHEEAFVNCPM